MKVAVTGGTGVVGRAVVDELVSSGHEVRALYRSAEDASRLASAGAEGVSGDILHHETISALVRGCEVVFNIAGVNQMCARDPSKMRRVNVEGVANVLNACRIEGVRRLVHTSSAVTIGEPHGQVGNEDSTHRGSFLSEYERTKYIGELAVHENTGEVEVVSVNPSSVQGPGRATGTGKLILDVVNGKLPFLVEATISLIDIADCARGHLLAAEEGTPGSRYVLSGAVLSVSDALALASRAVGRVLAPRFIPGWALGAIAPAVEMSARLNGSEPRLCSEMARVMRHGHRYDGSKATRELGLVYRPIEETIDRTISWFQSEGLLEQT